MPKPAAVSSYFSCRLYSSLLTLHMHHLVWQPQAIVATEHEERVFCTECKTYIRRVFFFQYWESHAGPNTCKHSPMELILGLKSTHIIFPKGHMKTLDAVNKQNILKLALLHLLAFYNMSFWKLTITTMAWLCSAQCTLYFSSIVLA